MHKTARSFRDDTPIDNKSKNMIDNYNFLKAINSVEICRKRCLHKIEKGMIKVKAYKRIY